MPPVLNLVARLSIFRRDDSVEIEIEDRGSGCVAATVTMPLAAFASAVLGQGAVSCALAFNASGAVGQRRETKTVTFNLPPAAKGARPVQAARDAVAAAEVDGWVHDRPDAFENMHAWSCPIRAWTFTTVFTRLVPQPQDPAQ